MHSARNLTLEDFYLLNQLHAGPPVPADDIEDEEDELDDEEDEDDALAVEGDDEDADDELDDADDTDAEAGS